MAKRPKAPTTAQNARGSLGLFLLTNAFPIVAVVVVLVLRQRGEVQLRSLPEEGVPIVVALVAALVGIVVLGWGAYPALRWALAGSKARLASAKERMGEAGFVGKIAHAPTVAGLTLVRAFLWLDVLAVALCLLALVVGEVGALVALALRLRS